MATTPSNTDNDTDTDDAPGSFRTTSETRAVGRGQEYHWGFLRSFIDGVPRRRSLCDEAEEGSVAQSGRTYTTYESATSGRFSKVESVFEQDAGARGRSSVGRSSVPLREYGYGLFLGSSGRQHDSHADDYYLWCEFSGLLDCTATFPGDNEADWIQHHVDHFRGKYPSRLVCWFCDDHPPFKVSAGAKVSRDDREANFYLRMGHIKEHIYGDYLTRDDMRPDFHMIRHMYKHGQLGESRFQVAMSYTELPRSLQLPPEEDDRFQFPHLVCDLEKEERHRKRRERSRKPIDSLEQSIFEQGSSMDGSKMGRKREGSPVGLSKTKEMFILLRNESLRSLEPAFTLGGEGVRRELRRRRRKDVAVILHGQDGADVLVRERKELMDQGHYRAPPRRPAMATRLPPRAKMSSIFNIRSQTSVVGGELRDRALANRWSLTRQRGPRCQVKHHRL